MKDIKRTMVFIFIAAIFYLTSMMAQTAAVGIPAVDSSLKIYDFAGLFTPEESVRLAESAKKAMEISGAEFVILTITDDLGLGPENYSDQFYEGNGFGGDRFHGAMLYINMTERDVYFATYGAVVSMFSSRDIDWVLDIVAPLLSAGDYYAACDKFIGAASAHISENRRSGDSQAAGAEGMSPVFGLVVSLVAGAAVPLIMLMLHSRSMPKRPGISTYFSGQGFKLTNSRDVFLRTNTTRTPIPQNNTGGGRGGGGGGARSTPGGRSAGGGGRKF